MTEFEQLMARMDRLIDVMADQVKAIDELVATVDEELVMLRESLPEDKQDDGYVTLMNGERIKVK
ncbi:hypothetical protein HOP61_13345 [Halomonas daqingensis]|uniref:Heat shock factor binding protein 1 n=1 Tax=Billgrantia desiderata TaxID=52021 RepID=A0AAW4YVY3_9GAMM|nr:hypothetical protein [Halomonas desiderata]MCE8052290.1 hypothetical protein [Halomonas desiderata]